MDYRILINSKIIESRHVKFIEQGEKSIKILNDLENENESDRSKNKSDKQENTNDASKIIFEEVMNENLSEENEVMNDNSGEVNEEVLNQRPKRKVKKPVWHEDFIRDANFSNVVPNTYYEAVESRVHWKKAIENEVNSLNKTWELVDLKSVSEERK